MAAPTYWNTSYLSHPQNPAIVGPLFNYSPPDWPTNLTFLVSLCQNYSQQMQDIPHSLHSQHYLQPEHSHRPLGLVSWLANRSLHMPSSPMDKILYPSPICSIPNSKLSGCHENLFSSQLHGTHFTWQTTAIHVSVLVGLNILSVLSWPWGGEQARQPTFIISSPWSFTNSYNT